MKSAHDLLNDARLLKESRDDRGLSAALPPSFQDMPVGSAASSSKRSAPQEDHNKPSKRSKENHDSQLSGEDDSSRVLKAGKKDSTAQNPASSEAERRKAEIEALQASLLGTRKRDKQPEAAAESKSTKTVNGMSGKDLIAAQRAQFLESGLAARGKKRAAAASVHPSRKAMLAESEDTEREGSELQDFKEELKQRRRQAEAGAREAQKSGAVRQTNEPEDETGYAGEILEEEDIDDNDLSFLTHSLKVRCNCSLARQASNQLHFTPYSSARMLCVIVRIR